MQLVLEANNIPVSAAHFGAFLRFWKNFNLCQNYVNTQESKGYKADDSIHCCLSLSRALASCSLVFSSLAS